MLLVIFGASPPSSSSGRWSYNRRQARLPAEGSTRDAHRLRLRHPDRRNGTTSMDPNKITNSIRNVSQNPFSWTKPMAGAAHRCARFAVQSGAAAKRASQRPVVARDALGRAADGGGGRRTPRRRSGLEGADRAGRRGRQREQAAPGRQTTKPLPPTNAEKEVSAYEKGLPTGSDQAKRSRSQKGGFTPPVVPPVRLWIPLYRQLWVQPSPGCAAADLPRRSEPPKWPRHSAKRRRWRSSSASCRASCAQSM